MKFRSAIPLCVCLALLIACADNKPTPAWKRFDEMPADKTGVTFENIVVQDQQNHVLNYPYYFNGGGVATGDINNDGLIDLYFTGNMVPNKLYLNKGNFQFEDITDKARNKQK
jgi:hypothetical protein